MFRKIGGVGDATTGSLPNMNLHQRPAMEHPHQVAVRAHVDLRPDQVAGNRVQCLGHLDVMVTMHLRPGIDRQVVHGRRCRSETRSLLDGEQLGRRSQSFLGRENPSGVALGGARRAPYRSHERGGLCCNAPRRSMRAGDVGGMVSSRLKGDETRELQLAG